jgi:hypothetical protein
MYLNWYCKVIPGFITPGTYSARKEFLEYTEMEECHSLFLGFRIHLILFFQGIY